jgi:outer membrane protein assembly factor BamB
MSWLFILSLLPAQPAAGAEPPARIAGLKTIWRAQPGEGSGDIRVSAAGDAIVLQVQGGDTTVLDVATGALRVKLIDGKADGGPIDKYATTSRVLHGALVGPNKLQLSAIDLATGKLRWSRDVAGLTPPRNEYALRDTLSAVETPALDVVAFRHLVSTDAKPSTWHWEETLAALDPKDGAERWRRTITRWADQLPIGDRDTLTSLAADGDRLIVLKPGRLEAFDAATGSPLWDRPWGRPLAPAFGPGRVALAEAGGTVVQVFDTANGQPVAALPALPGVPESLFFFGGAVGGAVGGALCATSTAQDRGQTACFALEPDGPRPLWQRAYALAFTQALAEAQSLFVTVGGERLLMLDARSGAERWIASFPRWTRLWMATGARGSGRLFVGDDGALAAVAPSGARPAPLPGYLRFSLQEAKDGSCRAEAAEWIDGDGRPVWTTALPERLRGSRGPCAEHELTWYRRAPRHSSIPGVGTLEARGALWVFEGGGLLALDRKSGKIVLDTDTAKKPLAAGFFFDEGTFTWGACSGPAPHGQVFAVCEESLIYFNGSIALLIDLAKRRETARAAYSSGMSKSLGRAARNQTRIALGGRTLELTGITYMK